MADTVATIGELLEKLEATFQSDEWRQMNNEDKIKIVGKLALLWQIFQVALRWRRLRQWGHR
jgi:hypothetical protein